MRKLIIALPIVFVGAAASPAWSLVGLEGAGGGPGRNPAGRQHPSQVRRAAGK